MIKADLCIIGAGSGGLSVAAGAAQLGRKVVLFEKGEMGGDCLNYGCVPSKALLAAAKHAEAIRKAPTYGVQAGEPSVDYAAVMDHVHGVIAGIAPHDSQERFEGFGVTVIRETARFSGNREVVSQSARVRAKHFVIATGSAPFTPPIPGLDQTPYFTNETLFENRTAPSHLIIIGGGPIGIEMAQAHHRLGARVTVIEAGSIMSRDDADAVDLVRRALTREGVEIRENSRVQSVAPSGAGVAASLHDGSVIEGSHLLVAVGRRANIRDLDLEKAGVDHDERGVKTDAGLRTSNPRIYAIGDAAGGPQFTHMAGDHASTIVSRVLFKLPSKRNDRLTPHVTFCDPELAGVGLTENEARERYNDVKIAQFNYQDNDRARAERRTEGFIKVVTRSNGRILGATIVGKDAGELIYAWTLAIAKKRKVLDFTGAIAPYPTLSELSKRVAGAWITPTLFSGRTRMIVRLLSMFD